MPYYAYVLKSITSGRKYFGSCRDLQSRLKRHNNKLVRSTRPYAPYEILYSESFDTRSEAVQRERFFKTINGHIFLKQAGII